MPAIPPTPFPAGLLLPQAHPFLLLDQVITLEPGRRVRATLLPSTSAHWLSGQTISPVLWLEAMAQAAGIAHLSQAAAEGVPGKQVAPMLLGVERWRSECDPQAGDLASVEATINYRFGTMARADCRIDVGGKEVAQASLVVAESGRA